MSLRGKVVVVTGASSGIGRETAIQLARRGNRVVLAARRAAALEEAAARCRAEGGHALVVPTDVSREQDVERLVDAVLHAWGRIDVWINNAGVTLFAHLDQGPFEDHRRVIETNLFGPMLAARAVVPVFRRQGHGTLINVGSVLSKVGHPFVPSYAISKFALRGLSEVLRVELADEPDIHVCTLLPYAVDTPHFESGGNRIGRQARAMPPVQTPEKAARALVALIERPRRERHVPRYAVLGYALHALFPRSSERLLLHALRRFHFGARGRRSDNALYEPRRVKGRVHGRRPPQVSTPSFAVWAIGEWCRIQVQSAGERVQRWLVRGSAR